MMKKNKIILVLVVVIIIVGLIIFKNDIWGKTTVLGTNVNTISEKKVKTCYLTRTDSGLPKEAKSPDDIKYLELIRGSGSEVEGIINYLPAEKDLVKGKFIGVFNGEFLNIIYSRAEDEMEGKEQKIFKVYDDLIIESEYSEQELMGDTYMFKDISKVIFGNDGIFSEINCSDVDKKEVGLE